MSPRIRRLWRVTPTRAFRARQRSAATERAAFAIAHELAKQTGEFVAVCRLVPFNDWTVHNDGRVSFPIANERIAECGEIAKRNERRAVAVAVDDVQPSRRSGESAYEFTGRMIGERRDV